MGQYNLDYTHHKSLRRIGQDQPARDDVIIKRTSALTKQASDVVRLSPPLLGGTKCAISVLEHMRDGRTVVHVYTPWPACSVVRITAHVSIECTRTGIDQAYIKGTPHWGCNHSKQREGTIRAITRIFH